MFLHLMDIYAWIFVIAIGELADPQRAGADELVAAGPLQGCRTSVRFETARSMPKSPYVSKPTLQSEPSAVPTSQ